MIGTGVPKRIPGWSFPAKLPASRLRRRHRRRRKCRRIGVENQRTHRHAESLARGLSGGLMFMAMATRSSRPARPARPTRGGVAGLVATFTVVTALAVGVGGCSGSSGGGSTGTSSGTKSGTSTAGSSASYGSSSDVVSALKSAGHPCTPVSGSQGTSLSAPGLRSVTACAVSGSQAQGQVQDVTATVFDDHADAEAYATLLTSAGSSGLLIGGTSERAVLGDNWVVLVPDDAAYANQVSAALGGKVLGGSSSASASAG
jgi:hypothetical protein